MAMTPLGSVAVRNLRVPQAAQAQSGSFTRIGQTASSTDHPLREGGAQSASSWCGWRQAEETAGEHNPSHRHPANLCQARRRSAPRHAALSKPAAESAQTSTCRALPGPKRQEPTLPPPSWPPRTQPPPAASPPASAAMLPRLRKWPGFSWFCSLRETLGGWGAVWSPSVLARLGDTIPLEFDWHKLPVTPHAMALPQSLSVHRSHALPHPAISFLLRDN